MQCTYALTDFEEVIKKALSNFGTTKYRVASQTYVLQHIYVSPSVQTILDPGVGGQHPLILRHHHHVRLPRLVDEYLSGSFGLQELWGGPPLGCAWYKNEALVLKRILWVNVRVK